MAETQTEGAPADAAVPEADAPGAASDTVSEEAVFEALVEGAPIPEPASQTKDAGKDSKTTTEETTTAPSGGDAEEASPEPEDGEGASDPWAAAPKELRSLYEQQEKTLKNIQANWERDRKTVSGLQKKLDELSGQAARKSDGTDLAAKLAELEKKVAETTEEYSDVTGPLAEYTRAQREAFEAQIGRMQGEVQSLRDSIALREASRLEARFPNYRQFVDDHRAEFFAWVNRQPPAVVDVVRESEREVSDGIALADILNRFKSETLGDAAQSAPAAAGAPDPVTARRQEQRRSAQTPRSSAPPVPPGQAPGGIEDEEAYFNKVVEDMQRARTA